MTERTRAGVSYVLIDGLGLRGTALAQQSNFTSYQGGISSVTLNIVATNGFSGVPLAPQGDIRALLNLVIGPDGQANLAAGSAATAYPSLAIYTYTVENGRTVTRTIREIRESGDPRDLQRPMRAIARGFTTLQLVELMFNQMRAASSGGCNALACITVSASGKQTYTGGRLKPK